MEEPYFYFSMSLREDVSTKMMMMTMREGGRRTSKMIMFARNVYKCSREVKVSRNNGRERERKNSSINYK